MVERGADHLKALCVVATHLAERAWAVMNRGMPYVICDTDHTPVTPAQAKAITAERYTVPTQVRQRRRSSKVTRAGNAPQQARPGHDQSDAHDADKRGNLPHPKSSATLNGKVKQTAA